MISRILSIPASLIRDSAILVTHNSQLASNAVIKKQRARCVALVLIAIVLPCTSYADDLVEALHECSAVLVPNELANVHQGNLDEAAFDAMCGDWYASHRQAIDSALGASFVVSAVPIGVDLSSKSSSEDITRTAYCQRSSHALTFASKDTFWSRIASDESRRLWAECMDNISRIPGAHPIKVSLNTTTGVASVRYDASYGSPIPLLDSVEAVNLSCKDSSFQGKAIPSQGAGFAITCSWNDDDATTASVVVHTSRGDEIAVGRRVRPTHATISLELHHEERQLVRTDRICTDWLGTTDMHEWKKSSTHDGRCTKATEDGKWCKGNYKLTLSPRSGGEIRNYTWDCSGEACAWNDLPNHIWWSSEGTSLVATFWAGSHTIQVRLCGDESIYGVRDILSQGPTWEVPKRGGFVAEVPNGWKGTLNIHWTDGRTEAIPVSKETAGLGLISSLSTGPAMKYSYILPK